MVQRKIQTLFEAIWMTFSESMLSKYIWAEVVDTVYFMQDHTLISIEYGKTPDELMVNKKQTLTIGMCLEENTLYANMKMSILVSQ